MQLMYSASFPTNTLEMKRYKEALVLVAQQIQKRFGDLVALDGVGLELHPGETVGLLGPNGAGKTTLIKILIGLLEADSGDVHVFDEAGKPRPVRPTDFGVVLEGNRNFYQNLPAVVNAVYFGAIRGLTPRAAGERFRRWMERFDLADRLNDPLSAFSRGMQQKAAIATALLHDPPFLLLDEPTLGLDPESKNELERMIVELARAGKAILLASHDMGTVQRVADRVIFLNKGQIVLEDRTNAALRRFATPWFVIQFARPEAEKALARLVHPKVRLRDASTLIFKGSWEALKHEVLDHLTGEIVRVSREMPSLEDLFLHLVGGKWTS